MADITQPSLPVIFKTSSPFPLPSNKFFVPSSWKRYQLSQLINKALALPAPIPFDFLIDGHILRGSLDDTGAGEEKTLELEYIESVLPPSKVASVAHEDWVSGVSCSITDAFVTSSYDGFIRAFSRTNTQSPISSYKAHAAPITSISEILNQPTNETTRTFVTSSHDRTTRMTRFDPTGAHKPSTVAILQLHTSPVSSVTVSSTSANLLTAGWDNVIGYWSTSIPLEDEVAPEGEERKRKRRRVAGDAEQEGKRKAPVTILKSHTNRVSKAIFMADNDAEAISCGFDSTVRTWDLSLGVCTHTITTPEKPYLSMCTAPPSLSSPHAILAASTDRTVTLLDTRLSQASPAILSLSHSGTPSCLAPGQGNQVAVGAYDGVVRLWDLRSASSALANFRPFAGHGDGKVLALGWEGGVLGVGGEGGLEIWRVGKDRE